MNGTFYTYGTQPHAVTTVGSTSYTYDANGNMPSRGGQGLTWDVENRPQYRPSASLRAGSAQEDKPGDHSF